MIRYNFNRDLLNYLEIKFTKNISLDDIMAVIKLRLKNVKGDDKLYYVDDKLRNILKIPDYDIKMKKKYNDCIILKIYKIESYISKNCVKKYFIKDLKDDNKCIKIDDKYIENKVENLIF